MSGEPEQNKSVGWVALMLGLVVLYFGWAFLAAEFFKDDPESPAEINVWVNSVVQLPRIVRVIGYGFRERFWMIGVTFGLEVGVFFLWIVMRKLERELWGK
jgi:hypothetical protein